MAEKDLDKKGIIKALVFALLATVLGIGVLGWQYRRIESEKVPALEERLEEKLAESVLEKFMHARIQQNEEKATNFLTERAFLEASLGKFLLLSNMENYEIINNEKLAENEYRYAVKIFKDGERNDFVEIITIVKILEQYYIDSVELGG